MNLLLLTPTEAATQPVTLRDHRAHHAHAVLRARAGDELRVGILDGPLGQAEVVACAPDTLSLRCAFESAVPAAGTDTLLLAVPRPNIVARCMAAAAAMGYGQIVLFRSWRVDRNHLEAKVLQPEAIHSQLLSGLAQGMRTRIPGVRRYDLFKPFVEDQLDGLVPDHVRIVAHPAAATSTADLELDQRAAVALAIGPEGGFIDHEVDALAAHGFAAVAAGPHPLRVETALAYLTGQLALLRAQAPSE